MVEEKKPDPGRKPVSESTDFSEPPPSGIAILRRQEVSNTRQAPRNPHRDEGGPDKEEK